MAKKPTQQQKRGGRPGVTQSTAGTDTSGPRRTNPDAIAVDGVVQEALPNAQFTVKLENGHEVLACERTTFVYCLEIASSWNFPHTTSLVDASRSDTASGIHFREH